MAQSITVYDLENYPDNPKTMSLDQKSIVPAGQEGDEKWVLSFTTSAYSDNTNHTAISDLYVQEIRGGWLKSSGFVSEKFTIGASSKRLKIKLDNSTGADATPGYYTITLSTEGTLTGDAIAADMEIQIRALPEDDNWNTADDPYKLAYMNASVEYKDGRFWIISGSVSPYYTGDLKSSVKVAQAADDICYQTLGFNLSIDSQTIAGASVKEAMLAEDYTTNTPTVVIGTGTGVGHGDCLMITDGASIDYFTAISGTDTRIEVATAGVHGYTGIGNSYTTSGTKVQVLREQDPEQAPVAYYDIVDSIVRWGIKSITNQIDFSS